MLKKYFEIISVIQAYCLSCNQWNMPEKKYFLIALGMGEDDNVSIHTKLLEKGFIANNNYNLMLNLKNFSVKTILRT